MLENHLILINQPTDHQMYYSRAWRTTSTPDLAMATDDTASITRRVVSRQLGGSDHKPVILHNFNSASKVNHPETETRLELQEGKLGAVSKAT